METNRETEITQRVLKFLEDTGMKRHAAARKAGIDPGNFYKILDGERGWRWSHLESLAKVFGIPVDELTGGPLEVPIVARISALEHFSIPAVQKEPIGYLQHSGKRDMQINGIDGLYAVEVADRSMMPAFRPGTRFVIAKESYKSITNDDLVICPMEEGKSRLACLTLAEEFITLRSLNPTVPDLRLPRTHLKLCERVIAIYP